MDLNEMIERLNEEAAAAGMVAGQTAEDGNTSIAYLPGCLKKKKEEKTIEQSIKEATEEVYSKLENLLKINVRQNKGVSKTETIARAWTSVFPQSQIHTIETSALQLKDYNVFVSKLIKEIRSAYADDFGSVQMICNAIENEESLAGYEVFTNFESLVACTIFTKYNGINMKLQLKVDMSFIPEQELKIDSADILVGVENFTSVRISGNRVYLVNMVFDPGLFKGIKEVIDEQE